MLGDDSNYGLTSEYTEQPGPDGLEQAFIVNVEFIGGGSVCLVLVIMYSTVRAFTDVKECGESRRRR